MLLHVPEVLTPAELGDIRSRLAAAEWVDGRESVGPQGAAVKQNRQLREGSALALELGERVLAAVKRSTLFFSAALPLRLLPPFFNCYESNAHYGLHVDGAVRHAAGSGQPVRTDLSATLFLSDPDSFDGGDLVVVDTYGTHEVKLPAGDLILYPSTSLHRVEPVTRGTRLASFFWLQSMVRDDARRSMLFELDQTLQSLRRQHGETTEAVSLTGHYHNLLRMWAEV